MHTKHCFIFVIFLFSSINCQQWQNVSQLISAQGYPVENYYAETSDGFLLSIIRIPYGKDGNQSNTPRPAIFLQHGLLDAATTWVINSPKESLGFILADNGFDVYLGNVRGNTYSSQNNMYEMNSTEYWNLIDFDKMISIDLPTMVETALVISGQSSIIYVGHSQGTLMGFGAFSLQLEITSKIDLFIALAPVAFVGNVESIMLDFLADIDLAEWIAFFGEKAFLPSDLVIKILAGSLCDVDPYFCADIVFLLCGYDPNGNLNDTRLPLYMSHTPAGTSVRNMMHWTQQVASGNFQKFDYGSPQLNIQNYGQPTPPPYVPQNLTSPPLAFFTGSKDILADLVDISHLIKLLPDSNKPVLQINEPTYDHLDFVWGENAYEKIYPDVVSIAKNMLQ